MLDKATENPAEIQMEYYHGFRTGLLKHIKMEENSFPFAQKANGGVPIPLAAKLRLDHGALTALMVVPPDTDTIKVVRYVLEKHDQLEEEPGGMYDICESLTEGETQSLLEQLEKVTEVPVRHDNKAKLCINLCKKCFKKSQLQF